MTFSLTIGGTDVAGKMVLPEGLGELTSAADGQSNECLITVDDRDGSLTFLELDDVIAEESACAYPRSFTGIVTQSNHRRGTYKDGPGRVWDITITDLNERMHRRVLHDADANRPSETGTERLDWLMSSVALDGLLVDNGQIMANAWEYDPADYRGEYADDVLSSIVSASAVARWTFFAYWDPIAEEASLFYGDITTTTYDSTLSLTNYLPDKNDTTIFAPYVDVALTSEAEGIYDGVYVDCVAGKFYRQRASTFATYGKHRDGVMDSVRINNATTASRHMETYLDYHSGPTKVITATVQLPREQVNLIDAGMRVQVYFTHIEGYDDPGYTWVRVTRRTVTFTEGTNELYDVHLELSTRGISQTGGGNPGDFPHPQPCTSSPVPVQFEFGDPATFAVAPAAGSLLTAHIFHRNPGMDPPLTGSWTTLATAIQPGSTDQVGLYSATGDGTTTVYDGPIGSDFFQLIVEWPAGAELDAAVTTLAATGTAFTSGGAITPASLATVVGLGAISDSDSADFTTTPEAGTTVLRNAPISPGFHPNCFAGYQTDKTGATSVDATIATSTPWAGISYAVVCNGATDPPASGQWVYGEVLATTAGVGTSAFSYAAGSVVVRVDGVLISRASYTETDPSAGTITLSWTPDSDEVVTIDYQGA